MLYYYVKQDKEGTMMKKSVWLLILCLLTALACPAGLAESTDFTVTVTIPEDFEGELNGRLLFLVDNELPAEGEQLYDSVDVTASPSLAKRCSASRRATPSR